MLARFSFRGYRKPKGCRLSKPDDRDFVYETVARSTGRNFRNLPRVMDLREFSLPVRNQGNQPTCAAFVAATMKEINEKKNGDDLNDSYMSPRYIYVHRNSHKIDGMCGREVFKILRQYGSLPEKLISDIDESDLTTPEMHEYAINHRIKFYMRITTLTGLRGALNEIGACYITLPVYDEASITFWRGDGDPDSFHALTAVGYNEEGFVLRNSWGVTWNGDGHVLLPYNDWKYVRECWCAIEEDKDRNPGSYVTDDVAIILDRDYKDSKKLSAQCRRLFCCHRGNSGNAVDPDELPACAANTRITSDV